MKTRSLLVIFLLHPGQSIMAQQTYQDANALNTWNITDANWGAGVTWANTLTSDAVFAGTGESVTVSTVNARNLAFDSSGYILSGGTITLGAASAITTNQGASVGSVFAGASTSLTKAGAGTLTLTGTSTYTGSTLVDAGTLLINSGGRLNGTSSVTINNGGTLEYSGTTNRDGIGSGNKNIIVNSGGTLKISAGNSMGYNAQTNYANIQMEGGTFTLNAVQYINAITLNNSASTINGSSALQFWQTTGNAIASNVDSTIASGVRINDSNVTFNTAAGTTLTISGALSNFNGNTSNSATKSGFSKTGTGTLLLGGTNNYGGNTTVSAGTLKLGSNTALGGTTFGTSVSSGAVLDLNGRTIGAEAVTLTGAGISSGGALINSSATNASLSGAVTLAGATSIGGRITLSGAVTGPYTLTKVGSDTLTLSNTSNAHSATTISGGILSISSASNLGSGPLAFNSVGTGLTITGTSVNLSNNIALPGSGTGNVTILTPDNSTTTFSGTLSGGGTNTTLFFQGGITGSTSGALVLSGDNTGFAGNINVQRGPLVLGNSNAAGNARIILDSNNNANGALQFSGSFTIANEIRINYQSQRIGVGSGLSAGISGVISENSANGLEKVGAGALTLSNTNTFTGATLVSAGALFVNGSLHADSNVTVDAAGTIGGTGVIGGDLSFVSGATLNIVDINNPLSIGGNVTFGGFGFANITGWDYQNAGEGIYTLLDGPALNFDLTNVSNVGLANALTLGNGNQAYFKAGSLQVVIIPEPSCFLLGGIGLLMAIRRRR